MSLDTFVADCLRILIERKAREVAEARERELRKVMQTLREV